MKNDIYSIVKNRLKFFLPLFLMVFCPATVILIWYTNVYLEGSLQRLIELFANQGFFPTLYAIWSPVFWGSQTAWIMLGAFSIFEILLMKLLPGKTYPGPITPKGNVPEYKENGVLAFAITLFLYSFLSFKLEVFPPTLIYNHFGELLGALNIFSVVFCLFLYIKGRYFPSSSDSGTSGSFIFDFYWGTELYPRIKGIDIKWFTNCRFGLMSWGLILLSFGAQQREVYGLSDSMMAAIFLQLVYIAKFFIWEPGYMSSLDIMHDRAGYYICWGCLVWVPGVYTSSTLYLVNHPYHLGDLAAISILFFGTLFIFINYAADRQRQKVRATQGNCLVWRKKPVLTYVEYHTERGEKKMNILLASGWWGISRHFHYIPEIAAAFLWTLPALFSDFLPYFYVVFLTCLLAERAYRDDKRCLEKYGDGWLRYCNQVPYKIIPFVV